MSAFDWVRGINPIWYLVDLTGTPFNDTDYMFVLENTAPYDPLIVYHDPGHSVPWTNPIQFLANGTLPNNIYFDPTVVYRLEFRAGPTQSDALIYQIDNYVPDGNPPFVPGDTTFNDSQNQITNPQFALTNFISPFTTTAKRFSIAPGWEIICTGGSGTVTVTKDLSINGTDDTNSNPSYALRITASGWSTAGVIQTFSNAGSLWTGQAVSVGCAAQTTSGSPLTMTVSLIYSNQTFSPLTTTLTFNADLFFKSTFIDLNADLSDDSNDAVGSTTSIEYSWPVGASDVIITNCQLIGQQVGAAIGYIQTTQEQQANQEFWYYNPLLSYKPINSYLVGWDFPINPNQFGTPGSITGTPGYIIDQTIAASGGTLSWAFDTNTHALKLTAGSTDNAAYILQYLSGQQVQELMNTYLSVNVNAWTNSNGTPVTMRVYLYQAPTASAIPTLGGAPSVIVTLAADGTVTLDPGATGWVAVNNYITGAATTTYVPTFTLTTIDTTTTIDSVSTNDYGFNGWRIPAGTQTSYFAIVVSFAWTANPTVINIGSVSLVPGNIPTRPAPLTYVESLMRCQYYYQKSFVPGTVPANNAGLGTGETYGVLGSTPAGGTTAVNYVFNPPLRAKPEVSGPTTTITLYNPTGGTAGQVYNLSTTGTLSASTVTNYSARSFYVVATSGGAVGNTTAVHWSADARLGVV